MPALIYLPTAGETVMEGEIAVWHKNEGDRVEKDETICEAMTSKVALDITAPQSGTLFKVFAPVESKVPMGEVIAVIQLEGEKLTDAYLETIGDRYIPKEAKAQPIKIKEVSKEVIDKQLQKEIKASPIAKKMAAEKGVDLSLIKGTGPSGRITKEDVLNYQETAQSESAIKKEEDMVKVIKLTGVRKVIAERLRESVNNKPHVNFQAEVCMDELLKARDDINNSVGCKISVTTLIIYAVAKALNEFPYLNTHLKGDEIILHQAKHIGMAVGRDKEGLIVPVIKDVDNMSLLQLEEEINRLVTLAREDKLQTQDVTGGTFTVSNLGMVGIGNFNAIINPPEVGILAVSAAIKKPVVKDDKVEIASIMNINAAVDHSVVDGLMASKFVMRIKELLELPYLMLLNL